MTSEKQAAALLAAANPVPNEDSLELKSDIAFVIVLGTISQDQDWLDTARAVLETLEIG